MSYVIYNEKTSYLWEEKKHGGGKYTISTEFIKIFKS